MGEKGVFDPFLLLFAFYPRQPGLNWPSPAPPSPPRPAPTIGGSGGGQIIELAHPDLTYFHPLFAGPRRPPTRGVPWYPGLPAVAPSWRPSHQGLGGPSYPLGSAGAHCFDLRTSLASPTCACTAQVTSVLITGSAARAQPSIHALSTHPPPSQGPGAPTRGPQQTGVASLTSQRPPP